MNLNIIHANLNGIFTFAEILSKGKAEMKKNLLKAGIGLALITLFVGCNPLKLIEKYLDQIQVVATPKILEVHGNKVEYSLKGKIPAKAFHKKAVATITPVVHYNGKTLNLDPISLKGEVAEGAGKVIKVKEGGSFELSGEFDFADDMAGKDLYMDLEIRVCQSGTEKCGTFKKEKVALGMITTSKSVKGTEEVYIAGDFEPLKRSFQRSIFFTINSWTIRSSEKRSEAVEQLKEFASAERLQLKGISVNSFASPDGELKINQNLTEKRSESSYKFLDYLMKKEKVEVTGELYKKKSLEEDWDGFRKLVSASNLPDKSAALQIIASKQSNDEKEAAIKALDSWPTILDEMMPKLRRSDVILQGVVPNRSLEELGALASENKYSEFTIKELLYYAFNRKDAETKIACYKEYIAKRPTRYIGYNNLAAVYITEGDYNKAETALNDGLRKANSNDSLQMNMGIVLREKGELEKAMAAYERAGKAGLPVGYNKSIIHIINGSYDLASESQPSAKCDYNTSLTALLNGNYDEAISEINCQKTLSGDDYYLKAIANARKGNVDEMAAALSLAYKADKSFADKATNDMEFASYWERSEFKNAINL
jgi:tetratricopeptide (TPR) repeat protein